jgi:outer membrane biosynthesis protein TonB
MIAIASADGRVLKYVREEGGIYGFHARFGWVSEESSEERARARRRHGLRGANRDAGAWHCRFQLQGRETVALEGCRVEREGSESWLATEFGRFRVLRDEALAALAPAAVPANETERDRTLIWAILGSAAAAMLLLLLTRGMAPAEVEPEIAPVAIQLPVERQKPVVVPKPEVLAVRQETLPVAPDAAREVKRAVAQNLGFLGLLGQKDLKKAIGGVPTQIKDASAGAGPGGKEGSGGELLVGLGQGVQRTSVGNSGVQGLGGVGTKGRGGGAGGYGNTRVGSGEGKGISAIPVSQDMVLEGGLSRSVIQATIAKYLSQVRACYEQGLARNQALTGQVSMAFEIGAAGNVTQARVGSSTLGDAAVEQCIAGKLRTWQFPKPLGGVNVKVNYPFLLRPVSS